MVTLTIEGVRGGHGGVNDRILVYAGRLPLRVGDEADGDFVILLSVYIGYYSFATVLL